MPRGRWLLVLVAVVLVSFPLGWTSWLDHEVDARGIDVQATVVDTGRLGGGYAVDFVDPRSVDEHGRRWTAQVDRTTYDAARTSHRIAVRESAPAIAGG